VTSSTNTDNNFRTDITIVWPCKILFESLQALDLPVTQRRVAALEQFMARSKREASGVHAYFDILFQLFGLRLFQSGLAYTKDNPIGALTYYLTQHVDASHWFMRADPVYVMPNRDHLELIGNHGLALTLQQSESIVKAINDLYADTSWTMRVVTPDKWVLEQASPIRVSTHPLNEAIGRNVSHHLPFGDEAKHWTGLMNELQMLLHGLAINREREQQGMMPVNSLWFWGVGQIPDVVIHDHDTGFVQCWSASEIALAMAKLRDIPRCDLPGDAAKWLQQVITPGRHLVIFDEPDIAQLGVDPDLGWEEVNNFAEDWIQPIMAALQSGRINSVTLVTDHGHQHYLTRALNTRWWRRNKALF